ncbi:hypothetical protein CEUSTIGMA_g9603.t1 [Chlamydomonas eustigma]|uniref:peptidylprolyl isomerase n=1 Tax=Chlamydomonas eustigma TaxID=1157962 RepID=A0A250XGG9_9CHLO|nr:hypothetical protein CEUSTIGMA_g9603.t1 [Chlamydomonas eustigma]|eukprot:GAX82175.1 hypothetical protein CEUSTIGMA_g9603.t1 [Chlamydomonas eustigma]
MQATRFSGLCSTSYGNLRRYPSRKFQTKRVRLCISARLKEAPDVSASWTQSTDEVFIKIPVSPDTRGRDITLEIHPKRLCVMKDGKALIEGSLADVGQIKVDDCFWTLEPDEVGGRHISLTLAKKSMGYESWESLFESELIAAEVTDKVYMQIKIGSEVVGKMLIGLYGSLVPKTVQNFKALCTGEKGVGQAGKPLHFKGSKFHRVIPEFMAQGGDITMGNGFGGESIYGEKFEDESFKLRHDERGVLAMANAGPGTNGSQFYFLFGPQPHLDGKHVVFGKIEAGFDILRRIESVGTDGGVPTDEVEIIDCGLADGVDVEAILDENKQLQLTKS